MISLHLIAMTLLLADTPMRPEPWLPDSRCAVTARGAGGLHPNAMRALEAIGAAHRTTRSLDLDPSPRNFHGPDVTLSNRRYSSAVDISVRCLDEHGIQQLLGRLATAGFAAWYRANGKDGWKGANHIHAVWAAEPLKPQLRRQVESWLAGRTGLVGKREYRFWAPSEDERRAVESAYDRSPK